MRPSSSSRETARARISRSDRSLKFFAMVTQSDMTLEFGSFYAACQSGGPLFRRLSTSTYHAPTRVYLEAPSDFLDSMPQPAAEKCSQSNAIGVADPHRDFFDA